MEPQNRFVPNQKSRKSKNQSDYSLKIKTASRPASSLWGIFVLVSTFILIFGAVYLFFTLQNDFSSFRAERLDSPVGFFFLILAALLFLFNLLFFGYSIIRYFYYKSIPSVPDAELPSATVIVPAYNEGKHVYDTLVSLAQSSYPEEKLEILAINDGSKDDTWEWMLKAKEELGDRVAIFRQPRNMGKRQALYRGFKLGTGSVFVTVDSDSLVKNDTLRNLLSPFVTDPRCGAVAGNIRVLNKKKALLPKMLDVSFALSFEFVRAVESSLNSVLCTPGALSAYRREAVFNCLDDWINQTFMGKPSDIGEDRAMTNMILKQGYKVLFQRNAYAYTNVPENYKGLYKLFIRWGRSNVRENIQMAKFIFSDFRKESKAGIRILFINQSLRIIMSYPLLLFMAFFIVTHPVLFLSATLMGIFIGSSFPALFYAKRYNISEAVWAYTYSVLFTFGLFWITPYAIATASRRGWLTRELS